MLKAESGKPINSRRPIPTRAFPGNREDDLTGRGFSGLRVIGYYDRRSEKSRGSQWVCQCACGRYEVRRSIALKKQDPAKQYLCSVCESAVDKAQHKAWAAQFRMAG